MIAFWFKIDDMLMTNKEIGQILYGSHEDCFACSSQARSVRESRCSGPNTGKFGQPHYDSLPTETVI